MHYTKCLSLIVILILLLDEKSLFAEAVTCSGFAPTNDFECEGIHWVHHGNFTHNGPDGLIFSGPAIIFGDFTFVATSDNFVSFTYTSFLRCHGKAEIHQNAAWRIILTRSEANRLWSYRDKNVTYLQANQLIYNEKRVETVSAEKCSTIGGAARTELRQTKSGPTYVMIVEFTKFRSQLSCNFIWIIPVIIIVIAIILSVAICCYFRGRNKHLEQTLYIPLTHSIYGEASQTPLLNSNPHSR